jgi:hypothetical protein
LSFHEDKEGHRRRKPDSHDTAEHPRPAARKRRGGESQVGDALKTVYQRTVEEDIPPEMLDLLGKLG